MKEGRASDRVRGWLKGPPINRGKVVISTGLGFGAGCVYALLIAAGPLLFGPHSAPIGPNQMIGLFLDLPAEERGKALSWCSSKDHLPLDPVGMCGGAKKAAAIVEESAQRVVCVNCSALEQEILNLSKRGSGN